MTDNIDDIVKIDHIVKELLKNKDLRDTVNKMITKDKKPVDYTKREIVNHLADIEQGYNVEMNTNDDVYGTDSFMNSWPNQDDRGCRFVKDNMLAHEDIMSAQKSFNNMMLTNKLLRVRDFLRDGWTPDWSNNTLKSVIIYDRNKLKIEMFTNFAQPWAFQSKVAVDRFLQLMRAELEQYYKLTL